MNDPILDQISKYTGASNSASGMSPTSPASAGSDPILDQLQRHTSGAQEKKNSVKNSSAPPAPGIGKTIFDQALQGATFNFSDEITNRIGALGASLATGEKYSDMLKQANESTKQELDSEMQNHPFISAGSQLAGGILTGGAISDAAKGTTIANLLRGRQVAQDASIGAKAGTFAVNTAKNSAVGAATGAAYGAGGADEGQTLQGAGHGAKVGAALGAALPVANAAVGTLKNTVMPSVSAGIQDVAALAQKHNIPLSLDQLSPTAARQYLAKTSAEIPFSGGAKFDAQQQSSFNSAVLKTIGESADRVKPEVVDNAYTNIGKKFDDVLAGKTLQVTPDHIDQFGKILDEASGSLANDKVAAIKKTIDNFTKNVSTDGTITGEKIGDIRSTITSQIKRADPGIKEYLGDILNNIVDISTDGNPEAKALLTQARYQYKNLKTIEPILAKATDGDISPALLKNRVIQSYGAKNMATGNAGDLGDLARVGDLIKSKVGNSGTAQRAASMALLATPGAIAGAALTPGDAEHRLAGGALGAVGTIAAAKGYQGYNNSAALSRAAMMTPAQLAKLPPSVAMALLSQVGSK